MFFEDIREIREIIRRVSCAIFVIPPETELGIKNMVVVRPREGKRDIAIDQVRDLIRLTNKKQTEEQFLAIAPADFMNGSTQNAFLKTLEEPKEHYHFLLLTERPTELLPTILSRAPIFFLKRPNELTAKPRAQAKVVELAKELLVAKPNELIGIAEKIAKKKESRNLALDVVGTAIEITYKTYFITKNQVFLRKIPKLLLLYQNLQHNGHVKLHLVADLC